MSLVYTELDVKKSLLDDNILLNCGDYYSNDAYQNTLFRLLNLNYFKFVSIRFEPSMEADSLLEAQVFLTQFKPQKVEVGLSAIFQPSQYVGAQLPLVYQHRNLFGGAENLRLKNETSFLQFLGGDTSGISSLVIAETEAQLAVPQNIFGLRSHSQALFSTRLSVKHEGLWFRMPIEGAGSLGISLQRFEGEGGFVWRNGRRSSLTQEFNPLSGALQFSTFSDKAVRRALLEQIPTDSTGELSYFATTLELRPNYSVVFDNRSQAKRRRTSWLAERVILQGRGFLLPRSIASIGDLGYPVNLFFETDLRQYLQLGRKTSLAGRLALFVGLPLAKSKEFSLLDLYSIGGASSVRAFSPRSLGPGSTPLAGDDGAIAIANHTGNLLLESSLELRQRLNSYWEAAFFLDAGNVWNTRDDPDLVGEQFRLGSFYQELAVGTGAGIRFNLGYFVLRLDWSYPIFEPYLPLGERFTGDEARPGDLDWWFTDLKWNFTFGQAF